MKKKMLLIFGSQLFDPNLLTEFQKCPVFMAETEELCTYFQFHKQKIAFFLSSMRHYREELKAQKFKVTYHELSSAKYDKLLTEFIKVNSIEELVHFEIEDQFMEARIQKLCQQLKISETILPSPMFVTSREAFREYLKKTKKPFMKSFYEGQRKRTKILMSSPTEPVGGQFSFDEDNRQKIPKDHVLPKTKSAKRDQIDQEVIQLVQKKFSKHPGQLENFWPPTTRADSKIWLQAFFEDRFKDFGPYEDAMTNQSDFVHHSALTPMLNVGLLTPDDVLKECLKFAAKKKIPLNSTEGFVRQILGWREFIRGIYQNFSQIQESTNFWKHERKLAQSWYDGDTGIPPLDAAIQKAQRLGYNHHIERLMVIGNFMTLCEIHPHEAHRWFMEMYIDSSDWVMGPNVYGMGIFSDGGIFATKPYTCGSNYYLKMSSDFKKGEWCDIVDGLYWRFIDKHRDFYKKNPRMSMMLGTLDKMAPERKKQIFKAATQFLEKIS